MTVTELFINFTSRCNLRCVYCTRGSDHAEETDLSGNDLDKILAFVREHRPDWVKVGCYTETTMYPGWEQAVQAILAAGSRVLLISNFSKLLSDSELETIARCDSLQVSLDTLDIKQNRHLRKGADIRTILYNLQRVRAKTILQGQPPPHLTWICVPTEGNLPDLMDYVACAKACGVNILVFQHIMKFAGAPIHLEDLLDLPEDRFLDAWRYIREAMNFAQDQGIAVDLKNLELYQQREQNLRGGAHELGVDTCTMEMALGPSTFYGTRVPEAAGLTRLCRAPWHAVVLSEAGDLYPCMICGTPLANLKDHPDVMSAHEAPAMQAWRDSLLSGNLTEACRNCISAPIGTIGQLRAMP